MRAVAQDRAKELLPVGPRSLIEHGLLDLRRGGITEALVIVSPRKPELANTLGQLCEGVRLHYVEQAEPRGLADALSLAEEFAAREPFVCWLPDNLWVGNPSATTQIAAALRADPTAHWVGLLELPTSQLARYGAAGFVESVPADDDPTLRRMTAVLDKGMRPSFGSVESAAIFKGFPLDLYQPDLFARIRALRTRRGEPSADLSSAAPELDDTPVLQELARERRLMGVVLRGGTLYDCGVPAGYSAACAAAAAT